MGCVHNDIKLITDIFVNYDFNYDVSILRKKALMPKPQPPIVSKQAPIRAGESAARETAGTSGCAAEA
jgi:hypothetical protein